MTNKQNQELLQRADHFYGEYSFFQTDALIKELAAALRSREAKIEWLEREIDKARRQANGLCDGCGKELGDAFCTACAALAQWDASQEGK